MLIFILVLSQQSYVGKNEKETETLDSECLILIPALF